MKVSTSKQCIGMDYPIKCLASCSIRTTTEEHINVRIPKSKQNNNNKTVDVLPVHG